MRRTASWIFVGALALGAVAACDEENDKKKQDDGTEQDGGGGNGATGDVEEFCDRAAEFIADVAADPDNTELFDEGEALVEEGQEFEGEDTARAQECTDEVISALADIGG